MKMKMILPPICTAELNKPRVRAQDMGYVILRPPRDGHVRRKRLLLKRQRCEREGDRGRGRETMETRETEGDGERETPRNHRLYAGPDGAAACLRWPSSRPPTVPPSSSSSLRAAWSRRRAPSPYACRRTNLIQLIRYEDEAF
jgi:hypothetical protein